MSHTFNHQKLASKEKCMSGLRSSIYRVSGVLTVGCLAVALLLMPTEAHAVPASKVFLNGVPTPVFFNDGDSFRVLSGPLAGTRARLQGFNTLESYGRCHQWGDWTRRELGHYATLGTLNAQRGVWNCTSDMKKDFYGRILWNCKDLASRSPLSGVWSQSCLSLSVTARRGLHVVGPQAYRSCPGRPLFS